MECGEPPHPLFQPVELGVFGGVHLAAVIAVTALVFAYSLVNTFLVEAIFDWNGLGSYAADSIQALDTPSVIGVTLFVALVYVGANLVVDLLQALVDPRIRLR